MSQSTFTRIEDSPSGKKLAGPVGWFDDRMTAAGVVVRNPIRRSGGSGYFMLEAPDGVLLEVFEPGPQRDPAVRRYYGFGAPERPVAQRQAARLH